MSIPRKLKNVVNNYTELECKVREATSNDVSGPSYDLMDEICSKTNNYLSVTEIMNILWKRLNDSGKNWRHVYKSLILLDHLLKHGSDRILDQVLDNITTLRNLTNFTYSDVYHDYGTKVSEKAKSILALLDDLDKLVIEREEASRTNPHRLHNNLGSPRRSNQQSPSRLQPSNYNAITPYNNVLYPNSVEEENLQLNLALKQSLEDASKSVESPPSKSNADSTSQWTKNNELINFSNTPTPTQSKPDIFDIIDSTWSPSPNQPVNIDPWGGTDPVPKSNGRKQFEEMNLSNALALHQPESNMRYVDTLSKLILEPTTSGVPDMYNNEPSLFDTQINTNNHPSSSSDFTRQPVYPSTPQSLDQLISIENNPFPNCEPAKSNLDEINNSLTLVSFDDDKKSEEKTKKVDPVSEFLGEHKSLVDLDKLVTRTNRPANTNPFANSSSVPISELSIKGNTNPNLNGNHMQQFDSFNKTPFGNPIINNNNSIVSANMYPSAWEPTGLNSAMQDTSKISWLQSQHQTSISNQSMNSSLNPFL